MAKSKIRDIIYISQEPDTGIFWIAGIIFSEFIAALPQLPNLLLLRHASDDALPLHELAMDYLNSDEVCKTTKLDIYDWGDFWWLDVSGLDAVRKLPRQTIAELAFLGRLGKAYKSPWFRRLKNKFIYIGHDDGWLLRLYARPKNLETVLRHVIQQKARILRRTDASMTIRTAKQLVKLSPTGIAIDLRKTTVGIHNVGPTTDIDALQNRGWNITPQNKIATLNVRSNEWMFE
jgi:hypothetical protein